MTPATSLRRLAPALALLAGLAAVACTPETGTSGGKKDAGSPTVDAGGDIDAGPVTDGGTTGDGGVTTPTITSVTPPHGPAAGGTVVVIMGKNFVNGFALEGGSEAAAATTVTFGTNQASPTKLSVVDDTTIQVTVPPGTVGSTDITITNPNGSGVCPHCFNYYGTIVLTAVTAPHPAQGTTLGGTPFTLSGSGFAEGQLVLIGGTEASNLVFSADGTSISGITPAGTAGSADVSVISPNASAFLRRAFVYVAPMTITEVTPNGAPLAGAITATVSGTGFSSDSKVTLGGAAAPTTFVSDTELSIVVPASATTGAVDVAVTASRSNATLADGFAYYDSSRSLQIFAVSPRQGSVAGGTCAAGTGCLHLVGTGFTGTSFAVGANPAVAHLVNDNRVDLDLPAAAAPGLVDIQGRSAQAHGGAVLPNAFAYVNKLTLATIDPTTAPSVTPAGTMATLTGTGLTTDCAVSLGASVATIVSADPSGDSLVITVPSGPTGPADVRVTCGDAGTLLFQEAVLPGAFSWTAPLQILQVRPESGAIAGNTAVSVYGDGFTDGLSVLFGSGRAQSVQVLNAHLATVRTPPGNVGFVDVKVSVGADSATLPAGYGYYNPKNSTGGGSGGPMLGILNVTVLNSTQGLYGQPVDGVTVSINADQLLGTTDLNGQVTFSDAALLKAVSITGSKVGFETATIAHIDARDVTLFMQLNSGDPSTPTPQPGQEPATFQGTVCGFKLPPEIAAQPNMHPVAQVFFTYPYVYAAPPFGYPQNPVTVTSDCGSWIMQTGGFGATAMYAIFGVIDDNAAGAFTPYLMTVARGLQAIPGQTTTVPMVLDMHLDVTVPIHIDIETASNTVINHIYSYLDLGGEGVVPLGTTTAIGTDFTFNNHPNVAGQGLVFLDYAYTDTAPNSYSFYYRRQAGNPAAGVNIGPMPAFTTLTTPSASGIFTGTLAWKFGPGPQPDIQQIQVIGPDSSPQWSVILPGSALSVSLPPSALGRLPSGATVPGLYTWYLTTASSPRFDYDYFSFDQLYLNAWTSFTQNSGTFVVP
jgi:hypothetical protein